MWLAVAFALVIGVLIYKHLSRSKDYWQQYGIREIDTSRAVGKLDLLLARKTMSEGDDYAYQLMGSDKFCGVMEMGRPMILLKDMELIKKVLVKDFDHFADRRGRLFSKDDGSLKKMLPALEGDEWKGVRAAVRHTFTTGKIRRMMEYFNLVGKEWVDEYTRQANLNSWGSVVIDVLTAANQYSVEVISTTVFGMNAGVIKNPESTFAKMVNRLVAFNKKAGRMKFAFRINFPRLSRLLGVSVFDMGALSFFEKILDQGLKSRMKGETTRNDFLQLLVEAKKGELKVAGSDELNNFEKEAMIITADTEKQQHLTEEIMNAQSVVFFFAGFSTTSNAISFALYALALHPKIQERLRQEVDGIVNEDESLEYDDVGHLVYMDMVVCEVLRKFPAVERLERICTKEYRDPEIGLIIPKGTLVGIPLNSIHNDKQYYDHPDKFDPEQFSPEKKNARNPYAFMPFGVGPRNCIGMRFAQIEVKSALAHMVHSFLIEPTGKTPVSLYGTPAGLQLIPPKNLELKLTQIANKKK